jgi:hypothetical protein
LWSRSFSQYDKQTNPAPYKRNLHMSQILDQSETLRQQAIAILMAERQAIDDKLEQLGYSGEVAAAAPRKRACSLCGSDSHTARTCPQKNGGAEAPPIPTTGI